MAEKLTGDLFKWASGEEAKSRESEPENIGQNKPQDLDMEENENPGLSEQELAQITPPAEANPNASMFELHDDARKDAEKVRRIMDARLRERRQKKLDFGGEKKPEGEK